MTQLFYGFLSFIPFMSQKYKDSAINNINDKRLTNINWLEDRFNDQRVNHPNVKEFYELLFPLIRVEK